MKKFLPGSLFLSTLILLALVWWDSPVQSEEVNPFYPLPSYEKNKEERAIFVKERLKREWNMLKDPWTGKIPENIRLEELKQARSIPVRGEITASGLNGPANLNTYIPGGPTNIGGRTRAAAFDRRYNGTSNRVIIAGAVSGGILRSADGGATWTRVSPEDDVHSFTSLAQDPTSPDTWYAGGGEPIANSASAPGAFYLGFGIWKSTNNGLNWTKLTRTVTDLNGTALGAGTLEGFDNPLDLAHKIVVNPVNGDVYVAAHRRIIRSTNGGTSWNVVFGGSTGACSDNGQADIVCTNTGRFYIAINGGNPESSLRGIWTSANGNANSWIRIAGGQTAGVDSVANWRGNSYIASQFCTGTFISKRIVMGLAPSNQNILYVTYENGESQAGDNGKPEADLFKMELNNGNFNFTNLSANVPDFAGQLEGVDPFPIQEGYDLFVYVKPDDPNVVILGGVNLYRSTNGFSSPTGTTWIGGYGSNFNSALNIYGSQNNPNSIAKWSHPDMHVLAFDPTNPNRVLCGNDGGLQITDNIMANNSANNSVEPVSWDICPNYQTLQYFHVAMDPTISRNNFIGGSQDNGTRFRDATNVLTTPPGLNAHYRLLSGDGGAAAIGRPIGSSLYTYASTQFGNIYRAILAPGSVTGGSIRPTGLTATPGLSNAFGDFVTYFKIDFDNADDMYYVNFNRLFRTTNATTVTSGGWTELTGVASAVNPSNPIGGTNISISALELSRGDYFPSHVLYIGTSNGKVFRLNNPRNALGTQAPADITPPSMAGYVSDIAVNPNNDEEVMVTVSNYSTSTTNVISVFWTNNAKNATPTWYSAEGNLPLPSYRSCMIVVKKDASNNPVTEYYIGTSVGLYSATNIGSILPSNGTVNWVREGGNILNYAVVTSMDYRPQDNVLLVGTHGNGLYFTEIGSPDFRPNQNTAVTDPVRNDKNFIQKAYPTLVKDQLYYQTGNLLTVKRISIQVHNSAGQLMSRKETGYSSGLVDTRGFARGTYVLTITSEDRKQQFVQTFLKE